MTRVIQLSQGLVALIDDDDYELVIAAGTWHARKSHQAWYAQRHIQRNGAWTTQYMHVLLTGWRITDHINGDGLDNRRCNLREATNAENTRNARLYANNSSGYRGVVRDKTRWRARIIVDYRVHQLGAYATREEAALAYDAAARELFGEYARLNFPQPHERSVHVV